MAILDSNITPESFFALDESAKLKRLIYYASLAPSSHNTQPWIFYISDKQIQIFPNWQRRLAKSDPKDRELYISLGAAIANLILSAKCFGLKFEYQLTPEIEPVATLKFADLTNAGVTDKETLGNLCQRHCNRIEFEDKHLPESFISRLKEIAGQNQTDLSIVTEIDKKEKITEVVAQAIETAFLDKGFTEELSHWLKPSLKKYRDGMPGYNVGIPYLISFLMPWVLRHLNVSKQQRKMNEGPLKRSAAFIILSAEKDDKESWLKTGQTFEHIAIEAQKNHIELGVFAAPIEIGEYYKQLQNILGINSRPQIFLRLGYSNSVPRPSPRLLLEQIIQTK